MLATVATVLNAGEEVAAQEVLEMFIEVAEAHPRFLRRQLSETVSAMLQVCPELCSALHSACWPAWSARYCRNQQ